MNDEAKTWLKTWVVTYQDDTQGRRVTLTWGLTEDQAEHWCAVAKDMGLPKPRAERVDQKSDK